MCIQRMGAAARGCVVVAEDLPTCCASHSMPMSVTLSLGDVVLVPAPNRSLTHRVHIPLTKHDGSALLSCQL